MTIISVDKLFDELLGDIHYDPKELKLYNFFVRVGVVKARSPSHSFFEYIRDIGHSNIPKILRQGAFTDLRALAFVFPERWMSVHEQHVFMSQINKCTGITSVDILTSSPIIIGECTREMIRILTWDDDKLYSDF